MGEIGCLYELRPTAAPGRQAWHVAGLLLRRNMQGLYITAKTTPHPHPPARPPWVSAAVTVKPACCFLAIFSRCGLAAVSHEQAGPSKKSSLAEVKSSVSHHRGDLKVLTGQRPNRWTLEVLYGQPSVKSNFYLEHEFCPEPDGNTAVTGGATVNSCALRCHWM